MFQNASRMFQNAPECIQNVPECIQNVPEYSRMHAEYSRIKAECSRMHAVELACSYISLHAGPLACMQFLDLTWSSTTVPFFVYRWGALLCDEVQIEKLLCMGAAWAAWDVARGQGVGDAGQGAGAVRPRVVLRHQRGGGGRAGLLETGIGVSRQQILSPLTVTQWTII